MKSFGVISILLICSSVAVADPPQSKDQAAFQQLSAEAIAAINAGKLATFRTNVESRLRTDLAHLKTADPKEIVRLAAFREFAQFFEDAAQPASKNGPTLQWLAAQPHLLPTLMSAIDKKNDAQRVLDVIAAMRASEQNSLDQMPELATAIAVVWDKDVIKDAAPNVQTARGARLLQYFLSIRGNGARIDPLSLPWQASIFLVNSKLSDTELVWAAKKYRNLGPLASCYFDVPYDYDAYFKDVKKKITAYPYTMPNLLQYGGICSDEAYYATQACKALGEPSCVCEGQGGGGRMAHAWVGVFESANGRVAWNFTEGRYEEDLIWSANITDPRSDEKLTDADVGLLGANCTTSSDARLESELLLKALDLAPAESEYDIATQAIQLSSGNRLAWLDAANLGQNNKLTTAQLQALSRVTIQTIAKPYPDFAFDILQKLQGSNPADQIRADDSIAGIFSTRPDLVAEIRIRQGDLLSQTGDDNRAFNAYMDVLNNYITAGPKMIVAMERVDKLLRSANQLPRLESIYDNVFRRTPQPDESAHNDSTPFVKVGTAYVKVLDDLGNKQQANLIRRRLSTVIAGPIDSN